MKKLRIFPSIVLIGFGLYAILQDFLAPSPLFHWPTLLIIIGVAFLFQAYVGKEYGFIIPSILFLGLGVHFHIVTIFGIQLDHFGVILLFISLGFFLQHQKVHAGSMYAWLFLFLALFQLFSTNILNWFGSIERKLMDLYSLWPIVIILIGLSLFIMKRN